MSCILLVYIVVSQDVVTVAVVLLMHVLVETTKILFMLLPFSIRHQHICALILGTHLSSFNSNYFRWLIWPKGIQFHGRQKEIGMGGL